MGRSVRPSTSGVQEKLKEGWYASLDAGLDAAKREQKPVLIDMWATWCKNCLTMDVTTMKEPEVVAALNGYVKIKFQAEDPDREPATRRHAALRRRWSSDLRDPSTENQAGLKSRDIFWRRSTDDNLSSGLLDACRAGL